MLQYVGIALLPALPLLVGAALACAEKSRRRAMRLVLLAALIGLTLCATLSGSPLTGQIDPRPRGLWPPLGLDWFRGGSCGNLPELVRPIDLAGLGVAAALGRLPCSAHESSGRSGATGPRRSCWSPYFSLPLGLHLFYVHDGHLHRLVHSLCPTAAGRPIPRREPGAAVGRGVAGCFAGRACAPGALDSADFEPIDTRWAAADRLTKTGVPAAEIYVDYSMWMEDHGAFDDWLAAGNPGYEFRPSTRPGLDTFHDPFWSWLVDRGEHAAYRVQGSRMSEPGWRLIARDSFRGGEIFTYQAVDAAKCSSRLLGASLQAERRLHGKCLGHAFGEISGRHTVRTGHSGQQPARPVS